MKTKQLFKILSICLAFIAFSCSSDDGENNNTPTITSISITSSSTSVIAGESLTFTVTANTGEDLTGTSEITFGGDLVTGGVYETIVAGDFEVMATYEGMESNAVTVTVAPNGEELTSIVLASNYPAASIGDEIVFTVAGNNGNNLTADATITVNGMEIEGNIYVAEEYGTIEAVATYLDQESTETFTSNLVNVEVAQLFTQNSLIEDYTGTWCGWCPRISYAIEQVEAASEQVAIVAIHRGTTDSSNPYYDPFHFEPATVLENQINLSGYPTAMINRTIDWDYPEDTNIEQPISYTGDNATLGLAITANQDGSYMDIDVNVKFAIDLSSNNLKLVTYVVEDGLVAFQANYTDHYGGVEYIEEFDHNHVLRASLTDILGESIPSADTEANDVYTKNFSVEIPSNVANSANIGVVAFVVDGSGTVLNVRTAHFGDDQEFELAQ